MFTGTQKAKKILSLLLAAALMTGILSSCQFLNKSDARSNQPEDRTVSISDDLYSYQIALDGQVYTLPCSMSDLTADGWNLLRDDNLDPGKTETYVTLTKNNAIIGVDVYNSKAEKSKISDCTVISMLVFTNDGITVTMPGGFDFNEKTTVDDITGQYGAPAQTADLDTSNQLTYISKYRTTIYFSIVKSAKKDDNHANYVYVLNRIIDNDMSGLDHSKIDKAEMADQLESYQISLDGAVYTIPASYAAFTENGWNVEGVESQTLEPKKYCSAHLEKGEMKVWIEIYNPSDQDRRITDCVISQVEVQLYYGFKYLILPGNFIFEERTTVQDIIGRYGEPYETLERDNATMLTYWNQDNDGGYVVFDIMKEDGEFGPSFNSVKFRNTGD